MDDSRLVMEAILRGNEISPWDDEGSKVLDLSFGALVLSCLILRQSSGPSSPTIAVPILLATTPYHAKSDDY